MKSKPHTSVRKADTGRIGRKHHKLPPDLDGLFKRAAKRARKIIAEYDALNPGIGRECLVSNLLHDLMHLCDRDRTLGDFHEEHGMALYLYQDLLAENLWTIGRYDNLEAAWDAAEMIMFREL